MAYYPRMPKAREEGIRRELTAHPPADLPVPIMDPAPGVDLAVWQGTVRAYQIEHFLPERIDHEIAAAQSEYSLAGRLGHGLEPVIKPLGFDWKMGVGLVGAFAAREVFVSTMGIVYSVGAVDEDQGGTKDLSEAMRQDRYPNGQKVWTPLVAVSLLVWFVLAQQCMSTLAIVRRETGGWGWPIFMLVYMNGLAYVACLAVFQIGGLLLR
jgi:ferrous iron transport protein B